MAPRNTTRKDTPPVNDWTALLETATVTDRNAKRPAVDVPEEIMTFLKGLQAANKIATIPVRDTAHYEELKLIMQSGADKLDNASAICKQAVEEFDTTDETGVAITGSRIIGLRVSIGQRRGAKA